MNTRILRNALLTSCAILAMATATGAHAQAETRTYAIGQQGLERALRAFSLKSGQDVVFDPKLVRGKITHGAVGQLTDAQALASLLEGTGLHVVHTASGGLTVVEGGEIGRPPGDNSGDTAPRIEALVVTGTHISGAQPSDLVISTTQMQIQAAGQTDLGQFARSMPQSFPGGQNPGVVSGAGGGSGANINFTGGSSFNLRGLGPDATLTLLNGRRLPYNDYTQAIDLSQIPLAAVSRVDILLDGASAIYGSDAVGGVANIVLKPDFDGLTVTAREGGTTDGGDNQQQYTLTGGKTWTGGGFIASYNYDRNSDILMSQRDFTKSAQGPTSLYPAILESSGLFSGHQNITDWSRVSIDGFYSYRTNKYQTNELPSLNYFNSSIDRSYYISPKFDFDLPRSWKVSIDGVYSRDDSNTNVTELNTAGALKYQSVFCLCNGTESVEADGNGPIFTLPGGVVKLAVGVGFRRETLDETYYPASSYAFTGADTSTYEFAELNVPVVSPGQSIPGIRRLDVNVAVRHEDYNTFGGATTPKVGAIWSPTQDFDVKASWGRSFKAPTLYQEHQAEYLYLYPGSFVGVATPGATFAFTYGGNTKLEPEQATTVSTGLSFHPVTIPGLRLEANYFHVNFNNRIIQPLVNLGLALTPAYSQFVTLNPSAGTLQSIINSIPPAFFVNEGSPSFGPVTYNPANVVALGQNDYTNAALQVYDGVDIDGSYKMAFLGGGLTASGSASWLQGTQQNSSNTPAFAIVGTIYYPTHWRARAGLLWERDGWDLDANLNFVGAEVDNRTALAVNVSPQTTIDMALGYKFQSTSWMLKDFQISVSAINLFDAAPPYVKANKPWNGPFDSANYLTTGRLVSVMVSKHFF